MSIQVAAAISDSSGGLDDSDSLHSCFALQSFPSPASLADWLEKHHTWGGQYDVLCLLYSVVLTKGPDLVRAEREDSEESLVDSVHGHGSQSLVNLLLTGRATQNVWDGERDLCGLRLQGVAQYDSGEYRCQATTHPPTFIATQLIVVGQ